MVQNVHLVLFIFYFELVINISAVEIMHPAGHAVCERAWCVCPRLNLHTARVSSLTFVVLIYDCVLKDVSRLQCFTLLENILLLTVLYCY